MPLYGFEDYVTEYELQSYIEGLTAQVEDAKKKLYMLEGALALAKQMHAGKTENEIQAEQPA